ncbi:unnamed protein product [Dovyalis caffra]|uniref:Uncharacterized protein n=1 Tax=Dovyalis caffra TaxID=77055 RepID=A0AAV1SS24_9ROSI|nr:unnamed protein product [Dovyalis caffra]
MVEYLAQKCREDSAFTNFTKIERFVQLTKLASRLVSGQGGRRIALLRPFLVSKVSKTASDPAGDHSKAGDNPSTPRLDACLAFVLSKTRKHFKKTYK